MKFPLVPAELAFAGDGTPFSPRYGDIYHSSHGGLEQARHVFLAGNELPARWIDHQRFVILETGFGLGLNFLATWQAWQQRHGTTVRCLHYVAIEKHPFRLDDLKQLHRLWPELAELTSRLHGQWPLPLPGLHRLEFGDVILTLCFGDAGELLPQLSLVADAIYLDGFAPDRNPDLWSQDIAIQLARLAAPGATLATWSVAGDVRRRLASADFQLERRPGFGGKRDMLTGRRAGKPVSTTARSSRRIVVIGAGIAGAATAHALTKRGHELTVLDAAKGPASGASGNIAGVFRPLPSQEDGKLARLLRAGFLLGRRQYAALPELLCGWTGVLHVARDDKHEEAQRRLANEHVLPAEFCRYVNREQAAELAAWPVALGGWWFPQAGWINPPSLCRSLLQGIDCRFDAAVSRLERAGGQWSLQINGTLLEADEVILANGIGAAALVPELNLPIRPGRGQVSHVPEAATPPMNIVVTRLGYVTPGIDGFRCAGATTQVDDLDSESRLADHAENLFRLDMLLPGFAKGLAAEGLQGRVSHRPMSPDRLPLVGPLAAGDGLWIINGFGARGMVFASICAELLASQISSDPMPLESDLVCALAPLRFSAQASRKGSRRGL